MFNTPRSPGFIYIIQAVARYSDIEGDFYKIGLSIHPEQRVQEITKGLLPFLAGKLILTVPVQNMFDVEQKLHEIYDDKRVEDTEWFKLHSWDIEAIAKMGAIVDETLRPPKRKRATYDYIIGDFSSKLEDRVVEVALPLESLIIQKLNLKKIRLSKKLQALLSEPVKVDVVTYDTPENMYLAKPEFREWAQERLAWLTKTVPNPRQEQAVYMLRDYSGYYGFNDWFKRKQIGIQNIKQETRVEEIDYA